MLLCHSVRRRCRTVSLLIAVLSATAAYAASCPILKAHDASAAEQALQKRDYDQAARLYNEQLQQKPDNPELVYGLIQVLLRQQKVQEAQDLIQKASAKAPDSVVLMTALGQIQYRAGTPWLTLATLHKAMQKDPCYPQLRMLDAKMLRLNSLYASAANEVAAAHKLDPSDPGIRLEWLFTLPQKSRIAELESYLSTNPGIAAEERTHLQTQLDNMKKAAANPAKACHLVSDASKAEIPFVNVMRDVNHQTGFGLDVKFNDRAARLHLDTGASGLLVSRQVAERAGLKRYADAMAWGVGKEGARTGYLAYADDIRIGALEFRDCTVQVIDSRNAMEEDGLIGPDVFSNFLITLDYPMRKLGLEPLPPRPDDPAPAKPALDTGSEEDGETPTEHATTDPAAADPAKSAAAAPVASTHSGPHDRYVAAEMKDWESVMRIGNKLLIPSILNDKVTKLFILDTGAFQTILTPEVAREVSHVSADNFMQVRGISGAVEKVFSVDEVTFKFSHITQTNRNVVAFSTPGLSAGMGLQIAGFIGVNTLGQLTIKIDYRDGLVKFIYDSKRGYRYPGVN